MSRRVITAAAILAAPEETRQWLASIRGENNERRVIAALKWFVEKNPDYWIKGVREKTRDEDIRGIDVVVTTDDGVELGLQVKSSDRGWAEFAARGDRSIAIVVVRDNDQRMQLAEKAVEALRAVRT